LIALAGVAIGAGYFGWRRDIVGMGVTAFVATNVMVVALGSPATVVSMCGSVSVLVLFTHVHRQRSRRREVAR
ncbi:MAG: hypothetical protein V3S98_01585, partial [Dehalococcoidia bacterium]